MSNKRRPTSELNHDNWNDDEEPEEAGTFQKAPEDVLKTRVVRAAKRRITQSEDGPTKSAFGSFTGFKSAATTNSSSPFGFLKSNTSSVSLLPTASSLNANKTEWNGTVKVSENGTSSVSISSAASSSTNTPKAGSTDKESASPSKPAEYYAKLKGLNQSVAQWIKTHVDANPVCILTPIFRDYEKYLKEIEKKHANTTEIPKVAETKPEVKVDTPKPAESIKPTVTEEKKPTNFIFGSSSSKPATDGKSTFGNTSDPGKSIFMSTFKANDKSPFSTSSTLSSPKSIFSSQSSTETKKEEDSKKTEEKPSTGLTFPQTTSSTGLFSFGQSSAANTASAGFSFGSGKPFTFGATAVSKPQDSEEKKDSEEKEDDEEPPKPEFKPVSEEGSIFEQRCKVFFKKDGSFSDRGVGTLFLKPAPNDKMQLIVRAVNSLGNILINTLLTENTPIKRANKNCILLMCLPLPTAEPPPVPTYLKVKTEEEADALFEALEKHKK